MKPGGTGAESPKIPKSLKLSLRGSVEIQAQHRPSRLKKPRTESVWTDRLGRVPSTDRLGRSDTPVLHREPNDANDANDAKEDIPLGIYFGFSVGAL